MALVKRSPTPLRPLIDTEIFSVKEYERQCKEGRGRSYLENTLQLRSNIPQNGYWPDPRDPNIPRFYPLFDDIEECEKRAVEAMLLVAHYLQPSNAVEYNYLREANIFAAGLEELMKDHPELTAIEAVGHLAILQYLYFGSCLMNDEEYNMAAKRYWRDGRSILHFSVLDLKED